MMTRSFNLLMVAAVAATVAGCGQMPMSLPVAAQGVQSATRYANPGIAKATEAIRAQLEERHADFGVMLEDLRVAGTGSNPVFTFTATEKRYFLGRTSSKAIRGAYNSLTGKVTVEAAEAKSDVAQAEKAIRAHIERNIPDLNVWFRTLSVSPTPVGTVFTFSGVTTTSGWMRSTHHEVAGTYNSLTKKVTITKRDVLTFPAK